MKRATEILITFLVFVTVKCQNCPECYMNTRQLIDFWGYNGREHLVQTSDGYILSIHQIVGRKGSSPPRRRPVVFLQHGLEGSSLNWVSNLPSQSAGFLFSDAGFDVYMGNMRGNIYSRRHVNLATNSKEFWRFSYDQMAEYDLPAMVNYVLKIKKFFALAPVAKVEYVGGLLAFIAPHTNQVASVLKTFGSWGEFLPSSLLRRAAATVICGIFPFNPLCDSVVFLIAGANTRQVNMTRADGYRAGLTAGTSVQNIVHFGQGVNSREFRMFDWTILHPNGNKMRYGQANPPKYDVSKCSIPTYFFKGDSDILADPRDVRWLENNVRNIVDSRLLRDFHHMDFVIGLEAAEQVYHPIIRIISRDENLNQSNNRRITQSQPRRPGRNRNNQRRPIQNNAAKLLPNVRLSSNPNANPQTLIRWFGTGVMPWATDSLLPSAAGSILPVAGSLLPAASSLLPI